MLRAEEFEEFNQAFVIPSVERGLIFPDVKPCVSDLVNDFCDEVCSDFLVEEICLLGGEDAVIELFEALEKFFVGVEKAFKLLCIEDEILIDIGDDELL